MPDRSMLQRPLLISFSGIDGAGKSTQIDALRQAAAQLGLASRVITFWDDVVVGARFREGYVHHVLHSERGVGSPERPVARRDKNVRAVYLTALRHLLYFVDAMHLRMVVARARRGRACVIIFDRYLYDELANLPLESSFSAAWARWLARLAPRPEIAFLLDADPEQARARKPEYPVDFIRQSRQSYFRLAELLGTIDVVPPLALEESRAAVLACFDRELARAASAPSVAAA
jgi:thymidylate kinase